MPIIDIQTKIAQLLTSQPTGVLSTYGEGQPYTSLVAFAPAHNLKQIIFATDRNTRKYKNIKTTPRTALLIDDRAHLTSDFQLASAVTALGATTQVAADAREPTAAHFLDCHPALSAFVKNPACALMVIDVDQYLLVERFGMVRRFTP